MSAYRRQGTEPRAENDYSPYLAYEGPLYEKSAVAGSPREKDLIRVAVVYRQRNDKIVREEIVEIMRSRAALGELIWEDVPADLLGAAMAALARAVER